MLSARVYLCVKWRALPHIALQSDMPIRGFMPASASQQHIALYIMDFVLLYLLVILIRVRSCHSASSPLRSAFALRFRLFRWDFQFPYSFPVCCCCQNNYCNDWRIGAAWLALLLVKSVVLHAVQGFATQIPSYIAAIEHMTQDAIQYRPNGTHIGFHSFSSFVYRLWIIYNGRSRWPIDAHSNWLTWSILIYFTFFSQHSFLSWILQIFSSIFSIRIDQNFTVSWIQRERKRNLQ